GAFSFVRTANQFAAIPQLKLRPAEFEEKHLGRWKFLGGNSVRTIKGQDCTFAVLICFDLIAKDIAYVQRPRLAISEAKIDFLFVPECNPAPFHESYLRAAVDLAEDITWS